MSAGKIAWVVAGTHGAGDGQYKNLKSDHDPDSRSVARCIGLTESGGREDPADS